MQSARANENPKAPATRSFRKYVSSDSTAIARATTVEPDAEDPEPTPLTVAVAIRRRRLLLLASVVVAAIAGTIAVLHGGVKLTEFPATSKSATDRTTLLDDYNSYSGNVASAFGKPIEMVVAVVAQLVVLRFLGDAYTQQTISPRHVAIPLALSAGVGYLISNGINAVNVQLYEDHVHAVILASDLSAPSTLAGAVATLTTNVTHTVAEQTPGNLITNTVLRNVVLPRAPARQDQLCDAPNYEPRKPTEQLPVVDFGFPQRDWQSRLLQTARPATTLKLVANATDKSVNSNVASRDLPMTASLAADLVVYAIFVGRTIFPWGDEYSFSNAYVMDANNTENKIAILSGLLPPRASNASELEQRDWFLKAVDTAVTRQFKAAENTSSSDIGVEISHVEISPFIDFDAVTFEVASDPKWITTALSSDNTTRYTEVATTTESKGYSNCGPWPGLCYMRMHASEIPTEAYLPTPPPQVQVFGACLSDTGEDLVSSLSVLESVCDKTSNSSFMVVSIGTRLVADSLEENQTDGSTNDTDPLKTARITNLRSIYTFTVGRLSWRLENLAESYGAECGTPASPLECLGLQLDLATSSLNELGRERSEQQQVLMVSAAGLPTKAVPWVESLTEYLPLMVPLVQVHQFPFQEFTTRNILLPHNVGTTSWSNRTLKKYCDSEAEKFFYHTLTNHFYIEHGVQTAYTAATFFLLQNAVVRDVIPKGGDSNATTLSFDGNTQQILAKVSTPTQNAILTFVGCGIFMVCVLATVSKPQTTSDPLGKITAPQAIARVLLDDSQFPPLLLDRRVVDTSNEAEPQMDDCDNLTISHLAVVREADAEKTTSATEKLTDSSA